ncbi:serine/threonine-protein kinase [Halomonas denitrificans]|nr:serine/threonine-protein kinase [Halomonas denitrificans]
MDRRDTEGRGFDWNELSLEFDRLAEAAPAERAERLADLRADHPDLARELESLLDSLDRAPGFLERPALDLADADPLPASIGPYRVLERLGHGGMATVYRGRRDEAGLEQQVAIKVVRTRPGDTALLDRFAQEARVLSRLDHPGIARPLDAGMLDPETAWLAMDYVDGQPVDRYCEAHGIDREARIELLIRICEAVQFAHRNLVVHRDIKPANVLVDRDGRPRLVDFGIARILGADEDVRLTRTGELALTPQYASPEQFAGEPVTTATDVYALGALAYELLCGRPPLACDGMNLAALLEQVRGTLPERPSQAAGDASMRGDLDAILMMALRKEPERRYASAGDLAADLRRHLRGEPVLAHPDRVGYRVGKFLRRYRTGVAASLLFVIALAALAAVATGQAWRAQQARADAERETERAVQVLAFFQDMLQSADPSIAQGESPTVRQLLERTAAELDDADLPPLARATVEETVASTLLSLGEPDAGLPLARAASNRLAAALGELHPRTLAARHAEARFHLYLADYDAAIDLLEPTFTRRMQVLGRSMDTMSTLHNLSYAYAGAGQIERALELDRVQLEIVESISGPGSPEALTTMLSIGHGLFELGRLDEARDVFERVHDGQRAHLGDRHPTTLSALHNLATVTRRLGEIERAEAMYADLVELRMDVLGERHAQTLNTMNNLGELYLHSGRPAQAAPWIERTLAIRLEALGEAHPDSIDSRLAVASLRRAEGDVEAAREHVVAALALAEEHLGETSELAAEARDALAGLESGSTSDLDASPGAVPDVDSTAAATAVERGSE